MKYSLLYLRLLIVEPLVLIIGLLIFIIAPPSMNPWDWRFLRRYSWFNERIQDLKERLVGLIRNGNAGIPHSAITLQMHFADWDVVSQFLVKHILDRLEMENRIVRKFEERVGFFVYQTL